MALWLQLLALARITAKCSIRKANTIELKALVVFAFASLAPLLSLLHLSEVLLLRDGLIKDSDSDHLNLLLLFLDVLLFVLLGPAG